MTCAWGILLGLLYYWWRRYLTGAIVLCSLVISHWALDLIVHRPDLPLLPTDQFKVGFGLWNSLTGTVVLEGVIFILGVSLYIRATRALSNSGKYGFWVLMAVLTAAYLANIFLPPPPGMTAVAIAGIAGGVLIVAWAYWVDHNRRYAA